MGRRKRARRTASSDFGLIDRPSAMDLGLTPSAITHLVASGQWDRVHAGVYRLDVTPPSWKTEVRAAVMAAGHLALASHRTAAVLFGMEGVKTRMIEVTVPYTNQPIPNRVTVHRTRRVLPSTLIDGIPATSPERTLLDLAAVLPELTLEKAMMSVIHSGLASPNSIGDAIAEQGGKGVRGIKRIRRVLALADDGVTGSPSEVDLARLLRHTPIPQPKLQWKIRLPAGGHAYPDFAWPDRMKIVEIDGFDAHGSPERLHNDLIRQNALMQLGWEVRRFSARAVRRDPQGVISDIAQFVGS